MKLLMLGFLGIGLGVFLGLLTLKALARVTRIKLRLMHWVNWNQVMLPPTCKPIIWHGRFVEQEKVDRS